ncbi:carboxypeptidase-like regulatory domain-containing protein [Aureivirga sp. CE67]|uniref:carboxypeptidase-like regulatory domain-containing protein n=1 Tax=Aureivirga sp. CE67 TaxID=1788983 RepID=UPI0018C9609D|nr:carboxypeptidase-like regulatory domain-containing protein [Aureivirga sp. CE67]
MQKIFLAIFLFIGIYSFGQQIKLEGFVRDTLQNPLEFATVYTESKEDSPKFTITDEKGYFELHLKSKIDYTINVTFLGYEKHSFPLNTIKNKTQTIVLKELSEQLGEVKLEYTQAVIEKKDTVSFHTDSYTDGSERKLKDVLKKLPLVNVDKEGNVTVKGKKVNQVLVEGKKFFTGDSKIAVNNIPADAVAGITMLDNYNEVTFLKNVEDSEQLVMNIKLKKNKKNFYFGTIEAGPGIENKYEIQPKLFYYSPKTRVNSIIDFNNSGSKSFTLLDYINLEGGRLRIMEDKNLQRSIFNESFTKSLQNQDFYQNNYQFASFNVSSELSEKTDLNTYGIFSKSNSLSRKENTNKYFSNNLLEKRLNSLENSDLFAIGKAELKYISNPYTEFHYHSKLKYFDAENQENLNTNFGETNSNLNSNLQNSDLKWANEFKFYKDFKSKHKLKWITKIDYQNAKNDQFWNSENYDFNSFIPVIEEERTDLRNDLKTNKISIYSRLKHYWILTNKQHLYTTFGIENTRSNFETKTYQILEDNSIHDFFDANFDNQTKLNNLDVHLGLEYKFLINNFIFKPSIFIHKHFFEVENYSNKTTKQPLVFLPNLNIKYTLPRNQKMIFDYKTSSFFLDVSKLSNRNQLRNFNSVFRGVTDLRNQITHNFKWRYSKHNFQKAFLMNASMNYIRKEKAFLNFFEMQGIDYISSLNFTSYDYEYLNGTAGLNFKLWKFNSSINGNLGYNVYNSFINEEKIKNENKSFGYGASLRSNFKKYPNLNVNFLTNRIFAKSNLETTISTNLWSFDLDYFFLKSFNFKANYSINSVSNSVLDDSNNFSVLNANLEYQKEDSAWAFEINATNILDTKYREQNFQTLLSSSNAREYIMSRIIMFKVKYSL